MVGAWGGVFDAPDHLTGASKTLPQPPLSRNQFPDGLNYLAGLQICDGGPAHAPSSVNALNSCDGTSRAHRVHISPHHGSLAHERPVVVRHPLAWRPGWVRGKFSDRRLGPPRHRRRIRFSQLAMSRVRPRNPLVPQSADRGMVSAPRPLPRLRFPDSRQAPADRGVFRAAFHRGRPGNTLAVTGGRRWRAASDTVFWCGSPRSFRSMATDLDSRS